MADPVQLSDEMVFEVNFAAQNMDTDYVRDVEVQTAEQKLKDQNTETEPHVSVSCQAGNDASEEGKQQYAEVDAKALGEFLKAVAPSMETELGHATASTAFEGYSVSWDTQRDSVKKYVELQHHAIEAKTKELEPVEHCSGVSWNATGQIVGVSYGHVDHNGWCEHKGNLCTWNIMRRQLKKNSADVQIELPCCLMCCEFHPDEPSLIAGGLYSGEVKIWDIDEEEELMTSVIGDLLHREPIAKVAWVRDFLRTGEAKKHYNLISCSSDGKVLMWTTGNKLQTPKYGAVLVPTRKYHGQGVSMNRYPVMGATSVAFSTDASHFVVGTEAGGLVSSIVTSKLRKTGGYVKSGDWKYSVDAARLLEASDPEHRYEVKKAVERFVHERDGKKQMELADVYAAGPKAIDLYPNACVNALESHSGPVTQISFSPFHRNVLLTCSTDGSVRVYNVQKPTPLLYLEPSSDYITGAAWSPARPLVFVCCDAQGFVYVYDLARDMLRPVETFRVAAEGGNLDRHRVTGIQFSANDGSLLLACDTSGALVVWRLGTALSQLQTDEMHVMEMMGATESGEEGQEALLAAQSTKKKTSSTTRK